MGGTSYFLTFLARARDQSRRLRAGSIRGASYRPLVWSLVVIAVVALTVQVTHTGLDVLAVLILCAVVIALERTIGDWTADTIGPGWSSIGLMAFVGCGVWVAFANSKVDHLFAAAEAAGYHTLYWSSSSAPAPESPEGPAGPGGPGGPAVAQSPTRSSTTPLATARTTGAIGSIIFSNAPPRATSAEPSSEHADRSTAAAPAPRKTLTVRLEPPQNVQAGQSALIRAHVSAAGRPVPHASTVFVINGQSGITTVTDDKGTASVLLMPRLGHSYDIYVRVAGSPEFRETSASRSLFVRK